MKHVLLFRHGEVEGHDRNTYRGTTDVPLTPRGVVMSKCMADCLAKASIELLLTTNLLRTDEVGVQFTPLAPDTPWERETGFREMHLGLSEGMNKDEAHAAFPEWARLKGGDLDVQLPGSIDTPRKLRERVRAAWQRVLARPEARVGIVAHAGANAILIGQLKDEAPVFNQRLGALTEIIVHNDARVEFLRMNDDSLHATV
jgi:broad specificity phosphatase PhoE